MKTYIECMNIYCNAYIDTMYHLYLNKSYLSFNRWEDILELNQPIRNKNYLWRPCLLTNRDEMSNLYKGPSIVPTKFQFIWTSGFRGEDLRKSAYQKQELLVTAMFVNRSGRISNLYRGLSIECFLPSFSLFGKAVSEENSFFRNQPIRNNNSLWRPYLFTDRN